MNILQILPAMNTGGVETGVVDLARSLVRAGHKTIVVSNGGLLVRDLTSAGAKHYQLPVGRKEPLTAWRMTRELVKIIKTEKIDIVHARSRVPGWIAWLACRRTGTKFVTTCHGYYSQHFFSRVMGWGRKVIVASQAIGRHMVEDFKMPYERMSFIPRGVDLEKFKFRPPQEQEPDKEKIYRIGIIGRLTPIKGHPVFIKAIHRLISCDPNLKIKAFIIGEASGDKEDYFLELKKQVKKLGLDDHLEFSGRKSDIPEVLSELDIMVLATTVPEAFGRVIIEAQAVGVPVIATRVGGVVDVVQDGSNGLLVPPGDDRAIAEAILKLIKDKPLRDSLVQAGRESVEEKFNLNKMAAKILEVYKEVNSSLNILVIKLSALGDVILSIPSIRALREHFPQARISLLTDENGSHIVKGCPYLDEVVIYHKHSGPNKWREIFRLARILSKGWFDISVDLQNNKISHLTAWLAGVRQRYGYKKGITSKLLTTALDGAKMKIPPVEHQFRILSTIGLDIKKHKTKLELWPSVDDEKYIDNFLKEQWINPSGVLVGINPGSSPRWPSKRWPYKNYAQVCQVLAARNIRTVITGTQKELKVARHIAADSKAKPIIAVGKTSVLQLAELVRRCKVFICSDTAVLHAAAAVGTRCVVFFGPTDPVRHVCADDPAKGHVIMYKDLKCSPCYKGHCYTRKCLKTISVDEVLAEVFKILDSK